MTLHQQPDNPERIPTYSNSKLKDFEQCPLKFSLKYLDGMETGVETIDSFMGQRVHEALRVLYVSLRDDDLWPLCELSQFYEEQWDRRWSPDVRIVRGTEKEYFERGARCIENYYRAYEPFAESRTELLEEIVEFPLNLGWRGQRSFTGKIDRLASRPDGSYEIHDYKTGRPNDDKLEESWRQLAIYQCAIQFSHPEINDVELILHYLEHGENFCRRQTESETANTLQDMKRKIICIESQVSFPPNPSPLCDWCEFRRRCPAWR